MASKSSTTGQSVAEICQQVGKGSIRNRQFVLKSRPTGDMVEDNFEFKDADIVHPALNEVLVRVLYVSFDPYMRWKVNESKSSYVGSFEIGKPIYGHLTGQVIESNSRKFKSGDLVTGVLPFAEYITVPDEKVEHVPEIIASGDAKITYSLDLLGMPGETAYIGIYHIGKPKPGDTVLVSGAAGAVGSMVGQLAKQCGCYVVGIVGSKEKEEFILNKLKFDKAINYKTTKNMSQAIKEACPNGVDVYWDNVGGVTLEAAIENIAKFGRVIVCGAISQYQELHKLPSMKSPSMILLTRSASILGFIVFDYSHLYPEAIKGMSHFIRKGQITIEETVVEGFDKAPKAFVGLFKGENLGKMLVSVAQPLSAK